MRSATEQNAFKIPCNTKDKLKVRIITECTNKKRDCWKGTEVMGTA